MIHRIGPALTMAAGLSLMVAAPAAAQYYTDGYKFLQAVEKKDQGTVEQLLSKNSVLINSRDRTDGHTALHIAVRARAYSWLSYLLGKGADPNVADKNGVTPLMLASQTGQTEAIVALARSGAKVDVPNDAGETPLISAVHNRNLAMVRLLLAAGADPDRADNSGRSARDYAKLDGADSPTLAAIARNDKDQAGKKPHGTYGPSF
jgi:ankyrin repeat protein